MPELYKPYPRRFIEERNYIDNDPTVSFYKEVLPFLYTGYLKWKQAALAKNNPTISQVFDNDISARTLETLAEGVIK